MGWFDFSDWGGTTWAEDIDAAVDQAHEWIETTADSKGWSSRWRELAYDLVESAADVGEDAQSFWTSLADAWGDGDEGAPDGWAKLGDTFASASGASVTTTESRDEGSVTSVIGGALETTAEDLQTYADPRKSWVPWAVAAVGALGLWVYLGGARR